MTPFVELLAGNPLLLLFVVIGLGYLAGSVRIFGFQLGVVAVLFVGMAIGALDPRLALPEHIYVIGLVLFVYAVGLASGPGFFASFRKRGLGSNLLALGLLAGGAGLAALLGRLFDLPAATIAGLFCGALTNTPARAATVETVQGLSAGLGPEAAGAAATGAVVAYGLAYPFGVLGTLLALFVASRSWGPEAEGAAGAAAGEEREPIVSRTFRVANPALFGLTLDAVLTHVPNRHFSLSRMRKGQTVAVPTPQTVLEAGDLIVAVGGERELRRAMLLFGEESTEPLAESVGEIRYRRYFVSNKAVVGRPLSELHLEQRFQATVTRLRRGDVEFVPNQETVLELGDRIRVVAPRPRLDELVAYFGDSMEGIAATDFLSLSLGIVLGVLVGMIPIPLPSGSIFRLGFAGGPLLVSLVLGRLERTGPVNWGMPFAGNLVLRQIGLVFFMAGIGTRAGWGFGETFATGGWRLLGVGAAITLAVAVGGVLAARRLLRLPFPAIAGAVSGILTQPACLAYANQQAKSELPNVWYATVYPASMVAKILLAQLLASLLLS
ncbi:MAG: transporter [Thermoanaerobaculia bacterium]|nr:transporter [Thermoanaerobaculia bacterium]